MSKEIYLETFLNKDDADCWIDLHLYEHRDKYGKSAGSIRNQQMIDEGKPDLVVAFPGGFGTKDMVRRAKKHNIEVIIIDRE